MNTNLDKIALDLYGKIQTRFPDIKLGDEHAEVLSKKSDIPNARFFEFEYKDNGRSLGTIAITLDEDDGIIVQISGDIANKQHEGAFKFIRSFRQFAKDRLINFDVQNIGKDNLDKRDYQFQSKPKEQSMEPMMESKMYGTARMSYQDLGEAKLIIKHSQPINPEVPAGRTMHIESIYVENADGERFKFPYKHLNGARALAEHLKHGGNPYDSIGQYISNLSEELAQLRKFKGYVSRNSSLSEAMGDITSKVMERIEQVKKEVYSLQRPSFYEQFAEAFEAREDQMIPEEIMSDWIDRLTIRTFNEDLKTAFPYIFRLVDESEIPVKELSADDILSELRSEEKDEHGNVVRWKEEGEWTPVKKEKNGRGKVTNLSDKARRETEKMSKKDESLDPEGRFENFMDSLVNEDDEQEGENTLFSPNASTQQSAIDKFNEIMKTELKGGPEGINIIDSLKGIIDDPEFLEKMKDIDPDLDARGVIQTELNAMAENDPAVARIIPQLDFKGDGGEIGGQDLPPEATPPAPAPDATAGATPPAVPPAPPVAESISSAKLKAKFIKAKECGATLETKMDFGHREMTLHDAMKECGIRPMECGFDDGEEHSGESGVDQMLKDISGFWNHEDKNFTIGGTRAKIKLIKGFKDGAYPNAMEEDLHHVIGLIDKMDPSGHSELGHIKHLAGVHHGGEMDEGSEQDDFAKLMAQFKQMHPQADVGKMMQQIQNDPNAKITHNNTSSGTIDGHPASYDDAMSKFRGIAGNMGFDASGDDPVGGMMKGIQGKLGGMMNGAKGMQGQSGMPQGKGMPDMSNMMKDMNMPGMNEDAELAAMLKIAGLK